MTEPFDPYRDWLGIKGGGPGANYYRLLGLKLFETDSPTILAAADKAIARVQRISAAEHADDRQQILAELTAAKLCLMNPAARARYDVALRNRRPPASPAASPGNVAAPGNAAAPIVPAVPPAVSRPTAVPLAIPIARPVSGPPPTSEVSGPGASGPMAVSASLWDDANEIPRTLASATPSSSGGRTFLVLALGFLLAAGILGAAALAFFQFVPQQNAAPVEDENRPPPAAEPVAPQGNPPDDNETDAKATDVRPAPAQMPSASDADITETPQVAATVEEPVGIDQPLPAAADAIGFSRALNRARAALVARELELARRHLDRARELAQTPVHRETLEQLDALHAHLTRFVDAVRTGMPKFNAADELHVGDDVVAVIESEPERLSLRVAGVRRDYTPATLPAAIALVVAKAGADENAPASQAFLGAFHAADPLGDRAAARDYLKSAAAAGLQVDPLLHLLDQDVLTIRREGVPNAERLAAAERQLAEEFAVPIKGAKSTEQKSYLYDRLLAAAADSDDAALQFALVSEAGARAATAGDAPQALRAVDELARWFDVDALALKTLSLAKAGNATRDARSAREVAEISLALIDEAGERGELTKTLAGTAVAAARRARDAELLKKAVERRRQIERPKAPAKGAAK